MADTLERERTLNNIIDQVARMEERIRRLEERLNAGGAAALIVPEPETGGRWTLEVEDLGGDVGAVLVMQEL